MLIGFDPAEHRLSHGNGDRHLARRREVLRGTALTIAQDRQGYGETRFIAIGHLVGHMVVVVRTPRGAARRIVSMRTANEKACIREQAFYEPCLG